MPSRARKVDANQPAIVEALRKAGASVEVLSAVGRGVPDLMVGWRGRNLLMECKNIDGRGRKTTRDQDEWHAHWRGSVVIVASPAEALAALFELVK